MSISIADDTLAARARASWSAEQARRAAQEAEFEAKERALRATNRAARARGIAQRCLAVELAPEQIDLNLDGDAARIQIDDLTFELFGSELVRCFPCVDCGTLLPDYDLKIGTINGLGWALSYRDELPFTNEYLEGGRGHVAICGNCYRAWYAHLDQSADDAAEAAEPDPVALTPEPATKPIEEILADWLLAHYGDDLRALAADLVAAGGAQ